MINHRKNITTLLVVIMAFAQIGLAHHNSVHVINHGLEYSQEYTQDHSQNHTQDHHDEHNDTQSDCQICHLTDSLKSLDKITTTSIHTVMNNTYSIVDTAEYTQKFHKHYHSRAPPTFLI